jgi:hypothetical protein
VNPNIFDSKMIFSIVMASQTPTMAPILPTLRLDVLLFGTSSIPTGHAYQVAPPHTEMNGMMDLTSVILLALKDTSTPSTKLVLSLANQNMFDSKTIFFTVMVTLIPIMEQIPQDVLSWNIHFCIQMVLVNQIVLILAK